MRRLGIALWFGSSLYLACNFVSLADNPVCVGGACPPLNAASTGATAPATTGPGSGGAGGGACFADCDVSKATGKTGKFPCAVEKILANVCRNCHSDPPKSGAPFPIVTYEQSQGIPPGGYTQVLFSLMRAEVASKRMPFPPFKDAFTDAQRKTIVDWACACAPPRAADDMCN